MFGAARPGLLTIDTYRVGGMEQLATYAELADVPFEVVYDAGEIDAALKRLSSCDVIIIDTPGRSPASAELTERWRSLLDALAPEAFHWIHAVDSVDLLTKIDEVPRGTGVAELALSMELPVRWITDGQDVPTDLKPGVPRVLRSYGLGVDAESDWLPA